MSKYGRRARRVELARPGHPAPSSPGAAASGSPRNALGFPRPHRLVPTGRGRPGAGARAGPARGRSVPVGEAHGGSGPGADPFSAPDATAGSAPRASRPLPPLGGPPLAPRSPCPRPARTPSSRTSPPPRLDSGRHHPGKRAAAQAPRVGATASAGRRRQRLTGCWLASRSNLFSP